MAKVGIIKKEKTSSAPTTCHKCQERAVYNDYGQPLCQTHFIDYFETKVLKTIRKYKLLEKEDTVCVATSGGKDSLAVLYLTAKYCKKNNINFFALAIDEGIQGYRDHTLDDLKKFCEEHAIKLNMVSFKEIFGKTLDQLREKAIREYKKKPCTVCGIFRRTLLNRTARKLEATKLVTGHNLDDESQSLLMNVLQGNMGKNATLGPITGLSKNKKFIPRVKPLYFVSEKETRLYTFLKCFKVDFTECPNISLSFRAQVRDQINNIEKSMPGAKNGIVNSFLEILPMLKEKYKKNSEKTKPFSYCETCGDACSGKVCNACQLEELLCTRE